MRWPWQRKSFGERLIISWSGQTLAFVRATGTGHDLQVLQMGVEVQGTDSREEFTRRLQALGLKGHTAHVMLRPEQYQLLQIEAPAVAPEELRSAARYQIKEMVDTHLDDLTIDVVRQGDGQGRAASQLLVVAANNAVIREALDFGAALQWDVDVIDVQDMAQRNLQSLIEPEKATAALLLTEGHQALLTISAGGELYYSRRLDLPDGFMAMNWTPAVTEALMPVDAYTPVEEYVPDYVADSYGADTVAPDAAVSETAHAELDRAQRFVVEVQRSIDLWERTWATLPLTGLRVFAGERSAELARWLSRDIGQSVSVLDAHAKFRGHGMDTANMADRAYCLPLLGVLLRTEARKV